jgi:hypothetical protein
MGWTGWVFEMKDASLFSYGSSSRMEFFQLPDDHEFTDVAKVHNHSFVSEDLPGSNGPGSHNVVVCRAKLGDSGGATSV